MIINTHKVFHETFIETGRDPKPSRLVIREVVRYV
jgi:hypothetical protein